MKHPYIASLLAVLSVSGANAQTIAVAPRLVVEITIDQLRTDYMEAFSPLYSYNGFKRLLGEGAVFNNVSFPFVTPDRASAIAAIVTGTTPYYNGITAERWLDRTTLRPVYCVDDNQYDGILTKERSSASKITSSTLGDELKMSTDGKSVNCSVSPFRDAAVISAGHSSDGAFWINDETGLWCSTKYYIKSAPSWLTEFNRQKSPASDGSITWTPQYPSNKYNSRTGKSFDKPFKHTFSGARKYRELKTSGYVNSNVTDMAIQCATSNAMGNDEYTDLLSVTYYAGKYEGATTDGGQMEIQDTYARLDNEIGRLIDAINGLVGSTRVLFVVTGTGYQNGEQVDYSKYRIPTGTFYINRTSNLLNLYFGAIYGQGRYVETCFRNEIFLNHKLFEEKRVSFTDALDRAHEFLLQSEGVKDVYTYNRLMLGEGTSAFGRIRNGYNPDRRGDLLIEVASGWQLVNEDSQEKYTVSASLAQFPIILYGAKVKAEKITTPVTIDRLAPTISKSIHIRAPNACSSEPLF